MKRQSTRIKNAKSKADAAQYSKKSKVDTELDKIRNTAVISSEDNRILKIFINLYNGKTIEINLICSAKIKLLKKIIQEEENIPYLNQRLMFFNMELDDNRTCQECGIKNLSTLYIITKTLLVVSPSKKILTIPIQLLETVQSVKKKIQDQLGIEKNKQRLFYPYCSYRGKQLHDSAILPDSNMKGHLIHLLEVENDFGVFVEILESLRSIIYIPIEITDTIEILKTKIASKISITASECKLFFMDNELQNTKTLKDYSIQNETTLQLCEGDLIYIQTLNKNITKLDVKRSDTIDKIKKKIHMSLQIPYNVQTLYFHDRKLENFKTLANYNVGFGMKLRLQVGTQIFVKSSIKPKTIVEIQLIDTIKDLKGKICEIFGYPFNYQIIKFNGIELNNKEQLIDCNVKENSTLDLLIHSEKSMCIFIWCNLEKIFLEVDSNTMIKMLKSKCEEKLGISLESYVFYENSNLLDNDMSLSNYSITNQSILYLIDTKNECNRFEKTLFFIKLFNGNMIPIRASTMEMHILELKKQIEVITKIPVSLQCLVYNGKRLNNDILYCHKITEGSKIQLYLRQMSY